MADQNRYKIVKELLVRDYCVGGLALKLGISEAAVSQHLKILRNAGIITGEKRGYFRHYRVNQQLLKQAGESLLELSNTTRASTAQCPPSSKEDCPLCSSRALKLVECK